MRLHRLTSLEREKIIAEYKEVLAFIKKCEEILATPKLLIDIIVLELNAVKERFGDDRRTEIVDKTGDITIEDIIAEEDMVVTISHKRLHKEKPDEPFQDSEARRKGQDGNDHGRRGLRIERFRRLDPQPHTFLHRQRQGVFP